MAHPHPHTATLAHHPGRACVGRSSIAPGVINGSILVCFPRSAVQGSRTTAGQQGNSSWHLYHLQSWKNRITEASALSEPLVPAAIHAENICIKGLFRVWSHLTFAPSLLKGPNAFRGLLSVQGSVLSQGHQEGGKRAKIMVWSSSVVLSLKPGKHSNSHKSR